MTPFGRHRRMKRPAAAILKARIRPPRGAGAHGAQPAAGAKKTTKAVKALHQKIAALCAALALGAALTAPFGAAAAAAPPALSAGAACLMDAATGQVLYETNMDSPLRPASITKIMTVLLAVENASFSDTVTMTDASVFSVPRSASHLALTPGEQLTMEQALMGAMLPSANDAANGVAETVGGTIENFVAMMNTRAAELGAVNTHFVNANGLDADGHLTTAHDMALITRAALQNADFVKVFSTAEYTIPATNKQAEVRNIGASDKMMFDFTKYYYPGIIGGKSGYTEAAGHTLVSAAQRGGRTLISVVLAEPSNAAMYVDSVALLDYGFSAFTQTSITAADAAQGIAGSGVQLVTADPVTLLLAEGNDAAALTRSYRITAEDSYGITVRVTFSLPADNGLQYAEAASAELRFAQPLAAVSASAAPASSAASGWRSAGGTALRWVGLLAAAALVVFVCLLLFVRLRYDLRRLRRRAQSGKNNKNSRKSAPAGRAPAAAGQPRAPAAPPRPPVAVVRMGSAPAAPAPKTVVSAPRRAGVPPQKADRGR